MAGKKTVTFRQVHKLVKINSSGVVFISKIFLKAAGWVPGQTLLSLEMTGNKKVVTVRAATENEVKEGKKA